MIDELVSLPALSLNLLRELFFRTGGVPVPWAAEPAPSAAELARRGFSFPPSTFWPSPAPTVFTIPISDCEREVFCVSVEARWCDRDVSYEEMDERSQGRTACGSTIGRGRGKISGEGESVNGQSFGYSCPGPPREALTEGGLDVRGPGVSGKGLVTPFVGDPIGDASEAGLLRELEPLDIDL